MPKSRSGGDERVQKNHGGLAFRKKRVCESRVSTEMIATFCVVFFRSGVQGHRGVGETFFELEEEDQQRRQTFPWNAWKRTLIKAMERSSFGSRSR